MNQSIRSVLFALGFTALGAVGATAGSAIASGYADRGASASADEREGAKREFVRSLFRDLNLSDQQKDQAKELRKNAQERFRAQKDARVAAIDQLSVLVEDPKKNKEAIHALLDQRVEAMSGALHQTADDLIGFSEQLDPGQRRTLAFALRDVSHRLDERRQARGQDQQTP